MISVCPHCGHKLVKELVDGLAGCGHCSRVFDASRIHQYLAAGWLLRHEDLDLVKFQAATQLSPCEALFVYTFVQQAGYSHEEFLEVLKKLNIS